MKFCYNTVFLNHLITSSFIDQKCFMLVNVSQNVRPYVKLVK